MKIQRKKSFFTPKRIIIIVTSLIVLVVAGAAYWWFYVKPNTDTTNPVNTVDYSPATEQEKQDSAEAKQNAVEQTETPSPDVPTLPTSDSLIVTINRANQASAGQALAVRTQIDGASTGSCEATFSKGATTFTKTFTIVAEATTTICNGDVDSANFASAGEWDMSITAKSGGVASKAATQKVTIQK